MSVPWPKAEREHLVAFRPWPTLAHGPGAELVAEAGTQ